MSETFNQRLHEADILARIARQQAETDKFVEEGLKLMAESRKLSAEAGKLGRDRYLAPVIATASLVGAFAGTLVAAASLMHLLGK